MASSFINQVPVIINLIQRLQPKSILDIGKGFGKYGFLIHEYCGINNQNKIYHEKKLKDQSSIIIDAVEADPDLMLPHLDHLYEKVYFSDIFKVYKEIGKYDLILMIDVIEHLEKKRSIELLKYYLENGSCILIATPIDFFEQTLYESGFENHVSHWSINDFNKLGFVDIQKNDAGAIYLISKKQLNIRGFGAGIIKKLRRIARAVKNEL